jgi:hypothetical protein|tara:strand:+ start:1016 stop:1240 length:225 start_codon:yes stop_codon:yes gene_type:complete
MIIREIIHDLLHHTLDEVREKKNMMRLQTDLIDPIIHYAFAHLYPYIIVTSILFFFTFILAVAILIFILRGQAI